MRLTSKLTRANACIPSWSLPVLLLASLAACPTRPSAENGESGTDDNESSSSGDGDGDSAEGAVIICDPGETQCLDAATLEVCAPTGLEWEQVACEGYEVCESNFVDREGNTVAACVGPCEKLEDSASSEGCSFYTTGMYQGGVPFGTLPEDYPRDAIVVGNPQMTDATVELRWVPFGSNKEELAQGPVKIGPGKSYVFELDAELTIYIDEDPEATSDFRSGTVYHAVSDLPVVAYLHAPYKGQNTNGSTLLLPEHVLQGDYVVYNHAAYVAPNYFIVIAMENQTTVTWRPTVETAGDNLPLPFLEAGETGMQLMNRFDNMRIQTSIKYDRPKCEQDLSGTIIEADKPIWVVSAVLGLRIPYCGSAEVPGCDTIVDIKCNNGSDFAMEQNLPLDYWGREYVGPHSPLRGTEHHHWRIYAGEDNVTVTVTPAQPGTPINLAARGDWADLVVEPGTHLEFDGNGVFMPVQYVTGHYDIGTDFAVDKGNGSPAMVQMVPTAQFLDRYVFVTGSNYNENYVQVIRPAGAPEVLLDGLAIPDSDWQAVGEWEVATVLLPIPMLDLPGEHEISSTESFGIIQYGYSDFISAELNSAGYAYMGGMKAEVIFIP
jgi:hypothetical protein